MTLSLYVIEDGLAELLEAREATLADLAKLDGPVRMPEWSAEDLAEAKQALAIIDKTIDEYLTLEARKVDNYHRYLTVAAALVDEIKADQKRVADRRRRVEASIAYLKRRAVEAMERAGKKRVDGTMGRYLARKGNGGKAPLVIDGWDQEAERWTNGGSLHTPLPLELMDATVSMPVSLWLKICDDYPDARCVTMVPNNGRIREAIANAPTSSIPGARLAERGEHLEVK